MLFFNAQRKASDFFHPHSPQCNGSMHLKQSPLKRLSYKLSSILSSAIDFIARIYVSIGVHLTNIESLLKGLLRLWARPNGIGRSSFISSTVQWIERSMNAAKQINFRCEFFFFWYLIAFTWRNPFSNTLLSGLRSLFRNKS